MRQPHIGAFILALYVLASLSFFAVIGPYTALAIALVALGTLLLWVMFFVLEDNK